MRRMPELLAWRLIGLRLPTFLAQNPDQILVLPRNGPFTASNVYWPDIAAVVRLQ
jgi:hypothetical protein